MMETPVAVESGLLDVKLLALPHGLQTTSSVPGANHVLDNLFSQWLSLPETQRVVLWLESTLHIPNLVSDIVSLSCQTQMEPVQSQCRLKWSICDGATPASCFAFFDAVTSPKIEGAVTLFGLQKQQNLIVVTDTFDFEVMNMLQDAQGEQYLGNQDSPTHTPQTSSPLLPVAFKEGIPPPLSPRSSPLSPRSQKRLAGHTAAGSPLRKSSEPLLEMIPQFYFPDGHPPSKELEAEYFARIDQIFGTNPDGFPFAAFMPIMKEICKLPLFFSSCLFRKLDTNNTGLVTKAMLIENWVYQNMLTADTATRIFMVLKQPDKDHLTQNDFKPLMRELLLTHHGLEFLRETPEFQDRYAETVVFRIFYHCNKSGNGKLLLKEIKKSNLVAVLQQVDEEDDINKVLRFFSYEHFYVIYCKFWELDLDHDFLIDKDDLLRYGNHALTYRIVERIFSQIPRRFSSGSEGKMGYEDFVWFILSEEDKSAEPSLEYWFKCVDLDCDGVVTPTEMLYFYEEQLHRMECMAQEPVLFEDVLCQMCDMIRPQKEGELTLRDLKNCKLSGNFFNILFNLNKFVAFETRDPFLIRQEREDPSLTEWDRFAHAEYIRLSMEEDGEDISNGSADVYDEVFEAPY